MVNDHSDIESGNPLEGRKEMFYLTTHSTHFTVTRLYGVGYMVNDHSDSESGNPLKGRKEIFYLTTHSTHFIYGYMASDIW